MPCIDNGQQRGFDGCLKRIALLLVLEFGVQHDAEREQTARHRDADE
jgi:hypothetical protein